MIYVTIEDLMLHMSKAIHLTAVKPVRCGVDGICPTQLKEYWLINGLDIESQLINGEYHPLPAVQVPIKKPSGKVRVVMNMCAIDKALTRSLNLLLSPHFDKIFSDHSYAFRPKRGCIDALNKAIEYMNAGYRYVIKIDIKSFFDRIDHAILMTIIRKHLADTQLIKLINNYVRCDYIDSNGVVQKKIGVVQGNALSPLLGNIYLNEFDQKMEQYGNIFIRYADDILLFGKSKTQVKRNYCSAVSILDRELNLKINTKKTTFGLGSGIDFLGYHIGLSDDGSFKLFVSGDSIKKMNKKINSQKPGKNKPHTESINKISAYNRGWLNYFCKADHQQLSRLTKLADNTRRYRLVKSGINKEDIDNIKGYMPMRSWMKILAEREGLRKEEV